MPRPPSHQDSGSLTPRDGGGTTSDNVPENSTPETWVPPVWLLGDTSSSKRPHGRLLKLSVRPVPVAVRDAIKQSIKHEEPEKEEHKARLLRAKLQDQKVKQENVTKRLENVREKKEKALQDARKKAAEEAQKKLQQLEESMRSTFEQEQEERDQEWRQRIQEECDEERKRSLEKLQEKERKEDEVAAIAKRAKLDKASEKVQEAVSSQETAGDEIERMQKDIETYNQNRLEIVWLLKRVIKAEEKQKAALQGNPQVKTVAPKQA